MKVTDYIVEFIISKGITDIFGYPGGVICHFIDSTTKYSDKINTHINYHEQASAFSACGYAQETGKIGVAYTTSGPGATNLVTGIANAYYDSIPVLFLTGQVDTYGLKGNLPVRQRGFQETDVVSIVSSITKYAVRIDRPEDIRYELEKAYYIATSGNPGPVLLDLPADVQRADIDIEKLCGSQESNREYNLSYISDMIINGLNASRRPCLLVGNGIKQARLVKSLRSFVDKIGIPTVFSMPAIDVLEFSDEHNFGFIGANGHRYGNFIIAKSDLLITMGSRLDLKQVGNKRVDFCPNTKIIRIDIDETAFSYPVHASELQLCVDLKMLLPELLQRISEIKHINRSWLQVCKVIKSKLIGYDDTPYTSFVGKFCDLLPDESCITADVGQSEVWLAQQIHNKGRQTIHMSAGHGAMGYSLPAAIGTYYGSHLPVFSFNGDGGIQMNIQELQFLSRENLPIHVVIINNRSLGMIRGFQEANFERNYFQTVEGKGYSVPNFAKIAEAYGLQYINMSDDKDLYLFNSINLNKPSIIELSIESETALNPNFGRNGLIQDQRPYIDRDLFNELMSL